MSAQAPAAGLTYAQAYRKGWDTSGRLQGGLDEAQVRFLRRHGHTQLDAWEDGWLDRAAGRPMWHLRDCRDHGPPCG